MIRQKDVIFLRERIDFLKKNTGFTLTELIVTIAVSAILLSVSVAGIVAWVHHSDFVRNENYAETIYYAAQAELTRYRGNGQLAELEMLVKNAGAGEADIMGKVPVNKITDDYKASLTGAGDVDKYNEHYKDRLYYLKKDEGPAEENNPLGGLLSDYIYDGSIMDGAVCVEFDPSDGTVYSVTYSDKNEKFTYGEATGEKEFSLQDRTKSIRKKNRVGYYSTELSDAAPTAAGKTRVAEVQLINEEQLYLRWSLPGQFDGIRKFLSYTIEIYDKADDRLAYTFTLKGRDLKEANADLNIGDAAGEIAPGYVIEVTGERNSNYGTENPDAYENFSGRFIAYSRGSEMYLVLDSIDYGADPEKIEKDLVTGGFNTDALKNSASILQLFSEPKDIYIRIQAQGKPYKTSAWKQSNASNTLFADMKKESSFRGGDVKNIYEIKNARHLYNVRYRERENSPTVAGTQTEITCYRQTADVVWPVSENRLFHSVKATIGTGMKMAVLKDSDKCTLSVSGEGTRTPYFPAIPALEEKSVLEAESGRNYELKGFILFQDGGVSETSEAGQPEERLGLIGINRGTVQGLTFTGVAVQGTKNVGAVCGINADAGKILDTAVSGTVKGTENIGGLVGLDRATSGKEYVAEPTEGDLKEDSAYIDLTNYAEVTASDGKAGGIVGTLNEKGQAYRCENYGAVKGTETGTVYIGGIAGYNKGLVQSCVSAPDDTPPGRKGDGELEEAALKGIFVGGIVGCNNGGTIRDSSTAKETQDMSGTGGDAYIIGYRYVGGIVGYNNSAVEGGNEGTLINRQDCTNKAKVIGHDYVGGIVGANGLLKNNNIIEEITPENKETYLTCEIDEKYSSKMIVEDWVNEGLVEAVGSFSHGGVYDSDGHYAGGIAGYNAGDLKNCTTRINTSSGGASDLINQVRLYGKNASYVGGVAGYNVGHIYREDGTTSVNSVVSGKKYVGGIVGYNGTAKTTANGSDSKNSGKIENYELSGGNIFAESYAGGYVGLNTTKNLLSGTDGTYMLKANPNEVKADYMAGGVMGALILAPENNEDITVNCATDNFFGKVEATYAFAGGYAGYTQILPQGTDVKQRAEELRGKLADVVENATGQQQKLQELANAVLNEREPQTDGNAGLQFKYEVTAGETQFASIKAPIFAGGVIGCNSWNTKLLLQNIHNKVQVTATGSVTYDFISTATNEKEGAEKQDTFSFAGGIIGLVTPKAEVVSCGNSGAGSVQGMGTYGGGIAEVNLGTIKNCEAVTVSNKNYYGGIAGLNTNEGKILSCKLTGQISGGSYLGGIAACNESIIQDCTIEARSEGESAVIGTGRYVGGIAAVNRLKSRTENAVYPNEINRCTVNANIGVSGTGEIVGGLIGSYQGGNLVKVEVNAGKNIYGVDCVGGIAGEINANLVGSMDEDKNYQILNGAAVNAANAAGGIGGMLADGVSVEYCENSGMVRTMSGLAGGIVPHVTAASTVKDCRNRGSVEAVNNIAGGIAAENYGGITGCTVEGSSAEVTIKGTDSVGGIAGENKGTVSTCEINGRVSVSDINGRGAGRAIGGIAGRNKGAITGAKASGMTAEGKTWWPKITTLSQGTYLGGVAGTNVPDGTGRTDSGMIRDGGNLEIDVTLAQQGTVGGVAGANAGTITNMSFSGTVTGTSGSQYGTGGIAGRNELTEAGKAGTISNCRLNGGTVSARSGDSGFGGHDDAVKGTYVGGICGVNPEKGSITGCTLTGENKVSGDHGYVGGVVAYNLGNLSNSSNSGGTGTLIQNIETTGSSKCVIGGIAAYNGATGKLENCSTGTWEIRNSKTDSGMETYPVGGVIGSNKSIYDQTGLTNNASVSGAWMTGGIIGQQFTVLRGDFTIENCVNTGAVTAAYRGAGGIVGDWRGLSGRVRECTNSGAISVTNGDSYNRNSAGGIIGGGWYNAPVTITVERCGNDGKISNCTTGSTGVAGGIFGGYNCTRFKLTLVITDCYNAAEIQSNAAKAAGICVGSLQGTDTDNLNVTITRCVNYGKGTGTQGSFAGIKAEDDGTLKITQCLNVGEISGNQYPIVKTLKNKQTVENSYYFKNPYNGAERGPGTKVAEARQNQIVFQAIQNTTAFNTATERLTLSNESDGKYLQFTDVSGTYNANAANKQNEIKKLKKNFSADGEGRLLFGKTNGEINPPTDIILKKADDVYTVSYQADTETLFCTDAYELQIFAGKDAVFPNTPIKTFTITDVTRSICKISEEKLFESLNRADYTDIKARIRARKNQDSSYDGITGVEDNGRIYSVWSKDSNVLSTKPKLPTPRLRFEVVTDGTESMFSGRWVLENAEEYKDYTEAYRIVILDIEHGDKKIGTIDNGAARSDLYHYTAPDVITVGEHGERNIKITAYAEPADPAGTYSQSDDLKGELNCYPKDVTLRAGENSDKTEWKFFGTKKGELQYSFPLQQAGGQFPWVNITYMAEFWFQGKKVGENTVLLPNEQGMAYCTIDLSSMVDENTIRAMIASINGGDISKDVRVCCYPWEIGEVKYYETDDAGKIVSRTVPTAANASEGEAVNKTAFNSSYLTFYINGLTNYKMHPEPIPGDALNPDITADGVISYTLYWDMDEKNGTLTEKYADAEYAVTVTGKNGDTEVVLYQGSGDKEGGRTRNKVTLQENNWKYQQLILTVERLGKEGTPHYIGASVTKEYDIPIRLNSVQGLNAKLRDRDTLVIDVGWIPSTEVGVGGYEITVKGKNAVGKEISITVPVDGKDTGSVQIDLDEKDEKGEEIYKELKEANILGFSIAAVPTSGDADYMRSRESDICSVTIPARLDVPKKTPELMRGNEEITADNGLPPEAFTEFLLQLEDAAAPLEDAAYEVEYFIADKDAETNGPLKGWDHTAGNRPEDNVKGIYISAAAKMDGNLQSAKYMLNQSGDFDAQQAGRKIWYRVRAVSNNKISSVWTVWVGKELPKALLEPVEIQPDETADGKYTYTIEKPDGTEGKSYELSIRQPKAGFMPVEFAKGYEIYIQGAKRKELVHDPDKNEDVWQDVTPDPLIYKLEEAEPASDGTEPLRPFKLTKDGNILDDGITDAADIEDILQVETSGGETTYIYTLYTVTHSYEVATVEGSFIYSIPIDAKLCCRTKDNKVQEIWLEMPEGVALTTDDKEVSKRQFIETSLVDVTVIAPDTERYVVDELTRWQRVKNDNGEYTDIEISTEDVNTAVNNRIAVAGYYEDMLNLDEMSDSQLKLFRLKREDFLEEEEIDKSDVSGNDVTSDNDTASGNDTEKKDPEKPEGGKEEEPEDGKDKEQGSGGSSGSGTEGKPPAKLEGGTGEEQESGGTSGGTEEKTPAKPESGKDETQGSDETSEGGASGDSAEEKKSKEEKSGEQESGGEETSGNNMETDRAE